MARRQTLQVQGFSHANPIPAAARVGPLLMSGLINGTDPNTGKLADTLEAQCACMFQQVRHVLAAGGGTPAHLVRMTVWLKDRAPVPVWAWVRPKAYSAGAIIALACRGILVSPG